MWCYLLTAPDTRYDFECEKGDTWKNWEKSENEDDPPNPLFLFFLVFSLFPGSPLFTVAIEDKARSFGCHEIPKKHRKPGRCVCGGGDGCSLRQRQKEPDEKKSPRKIVGLHGERVTTECCEL